MSRIKIDRPHQMGLTEARKIAGKWQEHISKEFDVECTTEESCEGDTISFSRSQVKGTLFVGEDRFELQAQLGALLGLFKGKIEAEIVRRLDELLGNNSTKS